MAMPIMPGMAMAGGTLDTCLLQVAHNDPTLIELRLAYNFVGDQGCAALGKAISTNFVLQKLSLANAQIGPHGIEELCKSVAHNRTLQGLTCACDCAGVVAWGLGG